MRFEYSIRVIDWKNEEERDEWHHEALISGTANGGGLVITEKRITDNYVDSKDYYIGDGFFKSESEPNSRGDRFKKWIKENHPELMM